MYCSPEYHNNTDESHSLEKLQKAWLSLYSQSSARNLKYKISFSGGEPTVNKNFLSFIQWLRSEYKDNIAQIIVTTNGSANLRYYLRLYKYVDNISFSIHSEHIDESKFFNMIKALKDSILPNKFIHVNIMNEFWNQDRINHYEEILNSYNVSNSINEIDYSYQTRSIPILKGKLNLGI